MRFLVHVPVFKRYKTLELFNNTITELKKRFDIQVVSIGSCEGDRNVCESFGYHYVNYANMPLGSKFQAGINVAKTFDFDALILLGSDDILSASCLELYKEEINKGYDFIGFMDCYFFDLTRKNMRHWKGYDNHRKGEPIGAWRCFSRAGLDKMNWQLWGDSSNSVDFQMWERVKSNNLNVKKVLCGSDYRVIDLKNNENLNRFSKFPNSQPVNFKDEMRGRFSPYEINQIITY